MRLYLEYDREILIEKSDSGLRFTYFQFGKENFRQDLSEEEAALFAGAISDTLGLTETLTPIENPEK